MDVVLDFVHREWHYANFEFRNGDSPRAMPSAWCQRVKVTLASGERFQSKLIILRAAEIPGATWEESFSFDAGIASIGISVEEEGAHFVSFPELEDGTVLTDAYVEFGERRAPAHVLQVGPALE